MKLHSKLLLCFGGLWFIFLFANVLAMNALQQQDDTVERIFDYTFTSVVCCDQMKTSLDEINRLVLSAVWTRQPPSAAAIQSAWKDFAVQQQVQLSHINLVGERELTAKFLTQSDKYKALVEQFVAVGGKEQEGLYQQTLLPNYLAARDDAQAVIDLNKTNLIAAKARLQDNAEEIGHIQTIFAILGTALAISCVVILSKMILGPLQALTDSTRQLEAGNLDLNLPVASRDELGDLARAFNAMAAKLREYRELDHARLLRTQQTTQLAIDSLPDAVAVFSHDGVVEISNEQARIHFGLEPGRHQRDARFDWLSSLFAHALSGEDSVEPADYQSALQLFDSSGERFLLPRALPMRNENNAIIGVVVILVDITRLHRANELKSGLAATVSHELKTPLAATRFSVHLIAKETFGPLSEPQRRLVKAACEGADRLDRIIENLLQFQRIEEGQYQIRHLPMSPETIVRHAIEPLQSDFTDAGLQLCANIPANLPQVLVDPDLIGYVFGNLLSNTLKFVPRGGTVTIEASLLDNRVQFSITDDGPGVPREHLPKLFDRFFRAGAPPKIPGAGLGLAIARQLIEAHGGHIAASLPPSGGIQFTFSLNTAPQ